MIRSKPCVPAAVAVALLIALRLVSISVAAEPRTTTLLNFDWQFRPGEIADDFQPNATSGDGWQTAQLPHDASIYGDFIREGSDGANGWRPRGAGVDRKTFALLAQTKGKRVFVEFEGVYRDANVWINAQQLTRQLNGYLGFEVDLTLHVEFGGENVLVVSYDNRTPKTSRWYTGEEIYRDVWLRIVDPLHVPLDGTYVVTPCVSAREAKVAIETEVNNAGDEGVMARLITEIHDASGQIVTTSQAVAPIAAGNTRTFRQTILVPNPKLWDLDEPHLYTAVSKVQSGDRLVDVYKTWFGIRTIEMTPERGLLLNGKKIVAKGGDLHHDLGCLGSAALKAGYEKHIGELKAIACNSFRLSHNPHAPVYIDVAVVDKDGNLVPEKGREIRFDVEGPGVNAGVANGHVISDELWQADTRKTWNGRCRLVVRSGRTTSTPAHERQDCTHNHTQRIRCCRTRGPRRRHGGSDNRRFHEDFWRWNICLFDCARGHIAPT